MCFRNFIITRDINDFLQNQTLLVFFNKLKSEQILPISHKFKSNTIGNTHLKNGHTVLCQFMPSAVSKNMANKSYILCG